MAAVAGHGELQRDAAQALYERYNRSVYRYALSQVRSPQDAEDATQNTFLRAFAALQRGVVPENEAAWLFKIAHNVCLSSKLAWLRRRRVETPRDLDALPVEPSAIERPRDELFGLDDALAAMPPRMREAILLREWQGLSYEEIAQRLDTSRSAVESLLFRARRMLADQLESPLQRIRSALGLGQLITALRGLAGGASLAVKAAAVAVVAATGAGVTVAVTSHRPAPVAPQRPAVVVPMPAHPSAAIVSSQSTRVAPTAHRSSPAAAATPQQSAFSQPAAPATGSAQVSTPAPQGAAPASPTAATAPLPPGLLVPIKTPQAATAEKSLPPGLLPPIRPPQAPAAPVSRTGLPDVPTAPAAPTVPGGTPTVPLPRPPRP